jgi:hypothetical protein
LGEGVGFPLNQRGGGDLPGVPAVFVSVSLARMTGGALLSAKQGGGESVPVRKRRETAVGQIQLQTEKVPPGPFLFF